MAELDQNGNILGPTMARQAFERDLWNDLREKNKPTKRTLAEQIQSFIGVSLPGRPTRQSFVFRAALGTSAVVIVDLNKYRTGANLKALKEEGGVKDVILRMGGPLQFVADDWRLTEDPTWRTYFTQAKQLDFDSVGGYVVYSAGIDARNYESSEYLLDFVNSCMGRDFVPDYLIADDEVNTWWENGRQVTATAPNQVWGIRVLLSKFWTRFKKTPMLYTGAWFSKQASYNGGYTTMLDNFNRGNTNNTFDSTMQKQVLNWWAWYLTSIQNSNKQYANGSQLLADLPIPTQAQEDAYLNQGSHSLYDVWQLSSNWITPYVIDPNKKTPIGVDVSVTRFPKDQWLKLIGVTTPTPPPDPEPDPEPEPTPDTLEQRVALAGAKLDAAGALIVEAGKLLTNSGN